MHGFSLAYEDESGISEKPVVRRTWSLKGETPVIEGGGSWKSFTMAGILLFTPRGRNPRILFRLQPGSMDADDFLSLLRDIKRELHGKKLLLIWDGLPAHRAKRVTAHIKANRSWLRVELSRLRSNSLRQFIWSRKPRPCPCVPKGHLSPKPDIQVIPPSNATRSYCSV